MRRVSRWWAPSAPPEGAGSLLLLLFLFIFLLLLLFLLLFLLLLLLLGAPGMGPSRGTAPSTSSPLPSALARCLKVSFSSQPRSFLLRPFGLWYPGLLHTERKWNRAKKKGLVGRWRLASGWKSWMPTQSFARPFLSWPGAAVWVRRLLVLCPRNPQIAVMVQNRRPASKRLDFAFVFSLT